MLVLALVGCGERSTAEDAVAAILADPGSAKFQAVNDQGGHVCGTVNGKDGQGVYGGYARFVYDKDSRTASLDPRLSSSALPMDAADPACRKPLSYQSVEERLNCGWSPGLRDDRGRQRAFDSLWNRVCA